MGEQNLSIYISLHTPPSPYPSKTPKWQLHLCGCTILSQMQSSGKSSLVLFPEMQKLFALFSQMQKALAKLFALKKFSSSKDKLKTPTITTTKTKLNASIKPNVRLSSNWSFSNTNVLDQIFTTATAAATTTTTLVFSLMERKKERKKENVLQLGEVAFLLHYDWFVYGCDYYQSSTSLPVAIFLLCGIWHLIFFCKCFHDPNTDPSFIIFICKSSNLENPKPQFKS